MVRPLSLAQHTLYADLFEQASEDLFDPEWPENGSILVRPNRPGAPADHAYYQGYRPAAGDAGRGQRYARYLGRADDPAVAARIARFQRVKAVRAERTITVRALIGAGMPRPDRIAGRIIEAMARSGLFPDHAVLISDAAYQTYDGVLGVRLSKPQKATRGNHPPLEIVIRDRYHLPSILEAMRAVDPSFAAALDVAATDRPAFESVVGITSLDQADDATADHLGFLIDDPVQFIVLHGPGIPVTVPAPERFAVHVLIEQGARSEGPAASGRTQPAPDQAAELIDALLFVDRPHALASAFAWVRGVRPQWQQSLRAGISRLPDATRKGLSSAVGM